ARRRMRRAHRWADARGRGESVVRKASGAHQVALFSFDRQVTSLVGFDQWNAAPLSQRAALVKAKLAETSPSWLGTQLGSALIQAAEILAEAAGKSAPAPGRIVLISDLQEGSHLEPLQGYDWPKGVELAI